MVKEIAHAKIQDKEFPLLVEKDDDGTYVVECTLFSGCFTQGVTLAEALKNIREVIALCLEEQENRQTLSDYKPKEVSLHTIRL